ncbi:hypothetical protein L3Y34_009756 [Caenorhabditis briggsae]|uniref:F-box domain-containing protein n=3 Tax=Caenorhabditis briggsae TaxID=6238 RepID=A0AAE9A642_CAEBR|nr:hypothetical protein L3Y34_009756 [Caenorhabditis briggsae]
MVSWSQFPPEIKRKIAENYDFMSRNSMRNTCHVDRQIVDSTKFRIPRVRFGYKQDECLICIYTGIEKFLRLEILKFENGVVVFKCENSPDLADSIQKFIPSTLPLNEGLLILKSLLAHESIQISTMEWEIERFVTKNESFKLGKQMLKLLGKSKFRVKELEFMHNVDDTLLSFFPKICEWKNVEIVRIIGISLYSENMHPVIAHDYHRIGDVVSGKPVCYTFYCTHDPPVDVYVFFGIMSGYMDRNGSDKLHWATYREPAHLARQGKEHAGHRLDPNSADRSDERRYEDGNVSYGRQTQCGMWVSRYAGDREKELKLIHDREKCGIGSLCPKHADPFDYWYYQNLPRRLVQEPFWTGFKCVFCTAENPHFPATPDDLQILMRKIQIDENRKRKNSMEYQELNPMEYSWGFGRPNQTTSEIFEVSEDVVEKRESRWGTWFKIIFLPILISFFFYAIFY